MNATKTPIGLCARLLAASAVLLHAAPSWSQAPRGGAAPPPGATVSPPPDAAAAAVVRLGMRFQHLSTDDGMPQSVVTAIAEDRVGFMWLGTQEGLARWDGTALRVYAQTGPGEADLPSAYIAALAVDARGRLWIGTDAGLITYDVETDRFQRLPGKAAGPADAGASSVTALFADDRFVWVGHGDGSIKRFAAGTTQAVDLGHPGDASSPISAFSRDADGGVWVGTRGEGLVKLSEQGKLLRHLRREERPGSLASDTVNALLLTRGRQLWVGTQEGLNRMGADGALALVGSGGSNRDLTDARVTSLAEDAHGDLWVGSVNGLNALRPDGEVRRFEVDYRSTGGLSHPWVTTIHLDTRGGLWVGTMVSLNFAAATATRMHVLSTGHVATSFVEQSADVLWIGTSPGELIRFDRRTGQTQRYPRLRDGQGQTIDLSPYWVSDLHLDKSGVLWMAVLGVGLISFDPRTELAAVYSADPDEQGSQGVYQIAAATDDRMWLATWGAGLVKFDPRRLTFTAYGPGDPGESNVPSLQIYGVLVDRRDPAIVWAGTAKAGLVRFDSTREEVRVFRHDAARADSLASDDVLSLQQTEDGVLWVGTYGGGFHRLDPGTGAVQRIPRDTSQGSATVLAIEADRNGRLWGSTNGAGLLRYDPTTRRMVVLSTGDGAFKEYAQGASYRDSSGMLYFGALSGGLLFRPEQLQLDRPVAPAVVMTDLRIYNHPAALDRPVWRSRSIDLDHDETTLSVRFAVPGFGLSDQFQYQYRVDGLIQDWLPLPAPFVTLSMTEAGDYTLRVRAARVAGEWGEPGIGLAIQVAPPPWRTWWAMGIYAIIVIGLIVAFVRFQTRRVKIAKQTVRLAAVEREIELIAAVQTGLLPREERIAGDGFELRGFYRPAETCSGDWWWHEEFPGGNVVLVADVTGHGPGPAMVTAALASGFRGQNRLAQRLPMEERLRALNEEVRTVANGVYHVALTAIEIDRPSRRLTTYVAGGLPPLLQVPGQKTRSLVGRPSSPLGRPDYVCSRVDQALPDGGRVFLFTDGVLEIAMTDGRLFGMRRLIKLVEATASEAVEGVASTVLAEASSANGGRKQADDWTMTIVDWWR